MVIRRIIKCDICGNTIGRDDIRYRFKRLNIYYNSKAEDLIKKSWEKMDMCHICYIKLGTYSRQRQNGEVE